MAVDARTPMVGGLSVLSWCVATLLILYAVGGAVFSWLERDAELEGYRRHQDMYKHMRELYEFDKCGEKPFSSMDFCKNQQEFHELLSDFLERGGTEMKDHEKWTFLGSVFYTTTLLTTLGYGNLHPQTSGGQIFTVIFGLIGIPTMGYVLSHVGRSVVDVLLPACYMSLDTRTKQIVILSGSVVALVLIGGCLFSSLEGWDLLEACYFSACTLLTIGFGDLLPERPLSRLATVAFIISGLGVAASLIALLQIHVEIRGEAFAKQVDTWYDSVASECGGQAGGSTRARGIEEQSGR